MNATLPALTNGTEKQIAWAEQIRADALVAADKVVADWVEWCKVHNASESRIEKWRRGAELLRTKTDALWWIETRNAAIGVVMEQLAKAAK